MDTIYRGDIASRAGRLNAWADSLLVDHGLLRLGWSNLAPVVPGRLYRCNHPTPGRLARLARRLGLRTVINLRGACANGSDALSREAARRLRLNFVDVAMQSSRAPSRERLLELIAALRSAAEPALLHCKSGADRAGFAAGVFLLLNGGSVADALRQLSLRFGHLRGSRTGVLDTVLIAYGRETGGHADFAAWARDAYDPAAITAEFAGGVRALPPASRR